jgi:hypothetical protein
LCAYADVASDDSAPIEAQAEQIMSIYPIVDGQKLDPANAIPPQHKRGQSATELIL